jgi:dienelactone hydrolase
MSETRSAPSVPGRFDVGVVHAVVERMDAPGRLLPTEIWYPAQPTAASDATIHKQADHPLGLPHDAVRGLPPIAGPCPLIVFSHGNSGYRQQSTFLTTRLARAGFVVAAPDHVGNTFPEMLALEGDDARRALHREIRRQRPADLQAVVRALLDRSTLDRTTETILPPLPALDPAHVGALGHSFGGWTALKLPALDRRVQVVCSLAPVSEPFVGRRAFAPEELPLRDSVRALVVAARDDVLVDLETSLLPLFERLGPGASLAILDGADHFHFCDGIALLHRMHENSPRAGQRKPTRPLSELRGEHETQTLVADQVEAFFLRHLSLEKTT